MDTTAVFAIRVPIIRRLSRLASRHRRGTNNPFWQCSAPAGKLHISLGLSDRPTPTFRTDGNSVMIQRFSIASGIALVGITMILVSSTSADDKKDSASESGPASTDRAANR